MKKYKVLFIGETVTLAHFARPYYLGKALLDLSPNDFEVHMAFPKGIHHMIEDERILKWDIECLSSKDFMHSLLTSVPPFSFDRLKNYVNVELELFNKINPDVVIGDFRPSLPISTKIARILFLNITNVHWSPYWRRTQYPMPENSKTPLRFFPYVIAKIIYDIARPFLFSRFLRPINQAMSYFKLEKYMTLQDSYIAGDYLLFADAPQFSKATNLPENHRFLGPIIWSPKEQQDGLWEKEITNEKPLLYICMGSSGQVDLLPKLISELSQLPIEIIIATAGRIELPKVPENCKVFSFLPGTSVAAKSIAVICNGGTPSIQQALNEGTPVVGIASNLDQFLAMEMVVEKDAGILIRSDDLDISKIKMFLEDLIVNKDQSKFKQNALQIAKEFKNIDAQKNFLQILKEILA